MLARQLGSQSRHIVMHRLVNHLCDNLCRPLFDLTRSVWRDFERQSRGAPCVTVGAAGQRWPGHYPAMHCVSQEPLHEPLDGQEASNIRNNLLDSGNPPETLCLGGSSRRASTRCTCAINRFANDHLECPPSRSRSACEADPHRSGAAAAVGSLPCS